MAIYQLEGAAPRIDPPAYVHPDAVVIGDVTIGAESTIWPGAVLRGDYGTITVGARTSVQDGTVIHATAECSTTIGDGCVCSSTTRWSARGRSSCTGPWSVSEPRWPPTPW